jgi:ABC-type transport system substrate-binding protein
VRSSVYLMMAILLAVSSLLSACAPAASPTAAKPAAPAATAVPAASQATSAPASGATAAAPAATKPAAVAKAKRGGILIRMDTGENDTLDPVYTVQSSTFIESPAFEPPLRYELTDRANQKFEIKPELAETFEFTNPTTLVMKFRKGIKFHDGSDLTAEVVKWNLDRARSDQKSTARQFFGAITNIEVVDPLTVKLTLATPSPTILINMTKAAGGTGGTGGFIVSKAAYDKLGAEAVGRKPYGTGPFFVDQWLPDDRTIYKKFDQYWRKDANGDALPYLDGVTVRVVRDPSVMLTELRTGGGHVLKSVAPRDVASVRANPDLVLEEWPWSGQAQDFGFNLVREPWGKNLKLRQAAQYAIDRETMAKALGFGIAAPDLHFHWRQAWVGWDPTLPHYNFDLPKAKALMKEAGYPDGLDAGNLDTTTGAVGPQNVEMMQQMWAQIGIKVKLRVMESLAHKQMVKTPDGDWQANNRGYDSSPDPDGFSRRFVSDGGANFTNYENPKMDECMKEGRTTFDVKARETIYKRCQTILFEDALTGGLYILSGTMVFRKEAKNIAVQGWYIDLREAWLDK